MSERNVLNLLLLPEYRNGLLAVFSYMCFAYANAGI
jgi:hypothetical protein